jgi:hypothetical protein
VLVHGNTLQPSASQLHVCRRKQHCNVRLLQYMSPTDLNCFLQQHLSKDADDGPFIDEQILALTLADTERCC